MCMHACACVRASMQAGSDPLVYDLVGWLQGASKGCHAAFRREMKEREERVAPEKREVGYGRRGWS